MISFVIVGGFMPPFRNNIARKGYLEVEQPVTTSLVDGSGDPLSVGGSPGTPHTEASRTINLLLFQITS